MEYITREIASTNWHTILFLVCLLFLAIVKGMNSIRFADFIMFLNHKKYILSYQKPNKLSSPFNVVLMLLQIVSIAMFLYLCFGIFEWQVVPTEITLYIKISIIYAVLVLCKLFIEKIVATIFSIDGIVDEYLFYKISYRNFLGVLLIPFNMLCIYALSPSKNLFLLLLVVLFILNCIVLGSFYKKNEKIILNHFFYFILYLCALEIAPYFILFKLISN
ncbi:DUF4271 domain-containing protein [Aquimarina sp. U1-2]|uniref:DUF4271 domain-containing protein n=1 Tax=Aquimarina sp. U1-2 TaxID=2823141 RepID=UPI001AECF291|nr:DUF4271 domain-containing protein [Aquimarina sp. U1-2]